MVKTGKIEPDFYRLARLQDPDLLKRLSPVASINEMDREETTTSKLEQYTDSETENERNESQ